MTAQSEMSHGKPVSAAGRSFSPWVLILVVSLGIGALGVGVMFVVSTLMPDSPIVPPGVARATLADGSVLVLLKTDAGASPSYEYELIPEPHDPWYVRFGLGPRKTRTLQPSTNATEPVVFWMSRYEADTGRVLPFDNWSHCVAETANGYRVMAGRQHARFVIKVDENSGPRYMTDSAFDPLDSGPCRIILYQGRLPLLRPEEETFNLDVYTVDDGPVATLRVPFPNAGSLPKLPAPEPLPISDSDGDVGVTLTEIETKVEERQRNSQQLPPRIRIIPKLLVTQQGEASELWSDQRLRVADALGNEVDPYDCHLSPFESAWLLKARLFQDEAAPFTPAQRLTIKDVARPEVDTATELSASHCFDGVELDVIGVGGAGDIVHQFSSSRTHHSWYAGGSHHSTSYSIEAEYTGTDSELKVEVPPELPLWHVAAHAEGLTPDHEVQLLLTNQQGQSVKPLNLHEMGEVHVWMFEAESSDQPMDLSFTIRKARNVEFTIAPPFSLTTPSQ